MQNTIPVQSSTRRGAAQSIALLLTALFMLAGLMMTTTSDAEAQSVDGTICIESRLVQNHPDADSLAAGSQITSKYNKKSYLIITGGPTCTFNCVNGFDINCDGKLGDFCPVEFDRNTVRGAGQCLKWMAAHGSYGHTHSGGQIHSHPNTYNHMYSPGYLYRQTHAN